MLPTYEKVMTDINLPYDELRYIKAETNQKLLKAAAVFLIFTIILMVTFQTVEYSLLTIFMIGVWIISLWYSIRVFRKGRAVYNAELKQAAIGALANNMLKFAKLPNETEKYEKYCHYVHNARISDEWIDASELFVFGKKHTTGEDYFEGKYGLTEFHMSELKMTIDEVSDSDGYKTTAFKGVLFIADFKRDFEGLTVIETNFMKSNSTVGSFVAKKLQKAASTTSKRAKAIAIEHAEFSHYFTVRTDNEAEAHSILSPSFMSQLLDFCKRHTSPMMISFHHSSMFVAVWSHKNFIDSGIKKKQGEYDLRSVYDQMAVFFHMIEDLDLNNR
ncbi:DUF3137 domain-containing protein [Paenibacillus sinopodophylli]|uniref:DUF3137 domain-containing protein n=1 Tax=Paenibacillus sinopodophylli TaxID=1837342 RepID=UPI00110CB743|nr:DUF3137 domain-containing protein [Paenibacillus sinopodophylli]